MFAAVESVSGKIYVGVCIDTACTLGVCAERNAIFNMITNGEDSIKRVIAIDRDGKAIPPCGVCREFMTQLMPEEYRMIEIMMDYENERVVTLGDLTSELWRDNKQFASGAVPEMKDYKTKRRNIEIYKITVCSEIRSYTDNERSQAPQDSNVFFEV